MNRYFRSIGKNFYTNGSRGVYTVISDKPVTHPYPSPINPDQLFYPAGEVEVSHTVGKTIPHFGADSSPTPLSSILGIHSSLLNHIKDDEYENGDTDLAESIARANRGLNFSDDGDERGIYLAKAYSKLKDDPRVHPDTLFTSIPGKLKVEGAFVDPSLSSSVPTLIGMAKNDFPNTEIIPSSNLSPYSSKLAQNALKRGLISPNNANPDAEVTNDYEKLPILKDKEYTDKNIERDNGNFLGSSPIPQNQVEAGRETVREMLRGTRKRNTQPVTEKGLSDQFVIPVLEGYLK